MKKYAHMRKHMKKGVLAKLKSTYNTGFLTSCIEIDELVNDFKERQEEFDNGGIFVEIYDNETIMNTDVNVSKIAACIRNYVIKGNIHKDLCVNLILEVDILDTPMGRKLVKSNSSHSIEAYLLFDRIHKKFLITDLGLSTFIAENKLSSNSFFIVGFLTKQKEVSDKISDTDILNTDDDLLKFFWRQIKAIDIDAEESVQDEIVSATIIYKNGGETDCKLSRKLLDYLIDRLNGLFHKHDRQIINGKDCFLWFEEENINMKEYTDTELLEKVLPMLRYSIDNWGDKDTDIIDIKILESNNSYARNKSFVIALQNRINELAKKTRVEATNIIVDEDEDIRCCIPSEDTCEDACDNRNTRECDIKESDWQRECIEKDHEIWKLKRTIEALEYLIYNCIPKDDRRKY